MDDRSRSARRFARCTLLLLSLLMTLPTLGPAMAAGPAHDQWEAVFADWKKVLGELREVRVKYQTADDDQLDALRQEYDRLLERGEAMIPQLRRAAAEAYAESPGEDKMLERFLVKLAKDDVKREHYEDATEVSEVLIEHGCNAKGIYDAAGIAAFATHDFALAEKYLTEAAKRRTLSEAGEKHLPFANEYIKLWEEEQAIRKKEAEADNLPRVKLQTSKGDIVVELFENQAPQTVGNFIHLVEKGFYDELDFHRVLEGFMAQGGCPKGDGTGGPGYEIYCECYEPNARNHFRGSLSMAHAGRDTGGSQFFLTFLPTPFLNGKHTVFGRVIEGMEVLAELKRIDPQAVLPQGKPDKIIKAEVIRKRDHDYRPTKVR